jgi:C-terminal processing protease CtpA/Prc
MKMLPPGTNRFLFALLLLAPLACLLAASDDKGWFGLTLGVNGSAAANPVITSVMVQKVEPGSPAAQQHIAAGDEVIEIEGATVPGGKASELKPRIDKKVGETLHLRLKRASGESYSATMTALKRPPDAK